MKWFLVPLALSAAMPAAAFEFVQPYHHGLQATGTSEVGLPPFRPARSRQAETCVGYLFGPLDASCRAGAGHAGGSF